MPLHGTNFNQTKPTITLNGDSTKLGTTLRSLGEFVEQYVKVPEVSKPCTVTLSVPAGTKVHYTFGPQYPTNRVDNITCFEYTGPIVLTNNKAQDGTTIYVTAFKIDPNGKAGLADQSHLVIAKFHIHK